MKWDRMPLAPYVACRGCSRVQAGVSTHHSVSTQPQARSALPSVLLLSHWNPLLPICLPCSLSSSHTGSVPPSFSSHCWMWGQHRRNPRGLRWGSSRACPGTRAPEWGIYWGPAPIRNQCGDWTRKKERSGGLARVELHFDFEGGPGG